VFTSSLSELGDSGYKAIGELELIGNKKPIIVSYSYNGKGKLEDGREFLAFRGEVTFDRYEYGMKPVAMTEAEVTLSFRLELVKKD
jgi:polyisoprenoid-binding protein YceI